MKNNSSLKLAIMAMLTALSAILVYAVRFPLLPAVSFLEYDAADVPIIIGALLLGPASGLAVLFAACAVQALTVSAASGWIGFLMHFLASGALVLVPSLIYKKKRSNASLILGLVLGSAAMTLLMIPLNLVFTGIFLNMGPGNIAKLLLPAIIPFNLLKASINSAIAFAAFVPLSKILKKYLTGGEK